MLFLLAFAAAASLVHSSNVCINQPCAAANIVADIVFVVDASNAFSKDQFQQVQTMISNFTTTLTVNPRAAQVGLYTYGQRVKSYGTLTALASASALQTAIGSLEYQGSGDRALANAIAKEEAEVTAANGFRDGVEHLLVIILGDQWTGPSVFGSMLDGVRARFDAILVVAAGVQPIENAFGDSRKLAGATRDVFFAFDFAQLNYAALWIAMNACPGQHAQPTTVLPTTLPTAAPSVPCDVAQLAYDVYLVVDSSTALSDKDFQQLKQSLADLVSVFPVDAGRTQFALVSTASDSQLYYTGFHSAQSRASMLRAIASMPQDSSDGQSLQLSLQALEKAYLSKGYTASKVIVYFSGNTNWDSDPRPMAASLATKYGAKWLSVRWSEAASAAFLGEVAGDMKCVIEGSKADLRGDVAAAIQTAMCKNAFCR